MWPVARRIRANVADARGSAAVIEALESRRLLTAAAAAGPTAWELIGADGEHRGTATLVDGLLHVVTTSGSEDVQIGTVGNDVYVRVHGNSGVRDYARVRDATVERTRVRAIMVDAGDGNDGVYFFNYDGLVNLPTTINGGAGDDDLYGEDCFDNCYEPIASRAHQSSYARMVLNGGDGNDRLDARIGDTTLIGGAGDDVFLAARDYETWGNNTIVDEPPHRELPPIVGPVTVPVPMPPASPRPVTPVTPRRPAVTEPAEPEAAVAVPPAAFSVAPVAPAAGSLFDGDARDVLWADPG